MIGRIRGPLVYKGIDEVMVEAGGVGYRLLVSAATRDQLPVLDEEVVLWVTTKLRDDAISLYGFLERREQIMFLRLLKVNGVGPKLAFAIIAGGDLNRLESQLINQEVEELAKLPGVGKKLSRRLVLELGELLKKELGDLVLSDLTGPSADGQRIGSVLARDLMAALQALGYRSSEVETLTAKLLRDHPGLELEALLKLVLQELHRG
ncbi:MAG: Holliday junction branch migration protein RuvA [Deltaproteobacteria bacterium]|nr:Holliday junction branch migration protein RuvA [Deltaproteobacteria bacterium]